MAFKGAVPEAPFPRDSASSRSGVFVSELRYCAKCRKATEHRERLQGNISIGEEWRVTYCVECKAEESRQRTRGKVIDARTWGGTARW